MACSSGKTGYKHKIEALIELSKIERRAQAINNGEPYPIRCYHCPECGDYHLSSKPEMSKEPSH